MPNGSSLGLSLLTQNLEFKTLVKLNCSSWPWISLIKFLSPGIFACAYLKRFIILAVESIFNKKRREILGAESKLERLTINGKASERGKESQPPFNPIQGALNLSSCFPPYSSQSPSGPLSSCKDPLFHGLHRPRQFPFQSHPPIFIHPSTLFIFDFLLKGHLHTKLSIPQGRSTLWLCRS